MQFIRQQKIWQNKIFAAAVLFLLMIISGCAKNTQPVVIWTDSKEFALYAELFNVQSKDAKVIVTYKKHPAEELPPAKDETPPDLIAGAYLKNSKIRKHFAPLDSVFNKKDLDPASLYPSLLEYGLSNGRHYLLPVSFNLPAIIFSPKNDEYVPKKHLVTLNEIKNTAGRYNVTDSSGFYKNMGFGPSWNPDFLYTVAKLNGFSISEKSNQFTWNQQALDATAKYIRDWTTEKNTSTELEQDFAFKFLYTPPNKQVTALRCLYAFQNSRDLFNLSAGILSGIDFRWISQNNEIPAEDDIVTIGLYHSSKNKDGAKQFIVWLLNEENQKEIIERVHKLQLGTSTFGIASGFSSLIAVNEHVLPIYNRTLLGNMPQASSIKAPSAFPIRWYSIHERVILPYLALSTSTSVQKVESLENRIKVWQTQFD